jgi:hypothetical protein
MNLKNTFQNKYVKYAAIGGGVYLAYRLVKSILASSGSVLTAQQTIARSKEKPSYPDLQYKIYADKIYQAGMIIGGTDEDAIYDVFKAMNNDVDVAKLIVAFGKRRIEFSFQEGSLPEFITSELDEDEIKIVNKTLANKGIKYRF